MVHDLQTREKFYFICNRWLAIDKEDGSIDRIFPVAGEAQKTELKYLLKKQTTDKLSDGHLWFSILARPTLSSFTRLDRLTCCFVLLAITMLGNILYYDIDKSPKTDGLQIGPFCLTQQQISIGIMSNLIMFPPSFLIVQLFRKSRPRRSKLDKIKKSIDKRRKTEIKSEDKKTLDKYKITELADDEEIIEKKMFRAKIFSKTS